jgi:hypothetical protein
LLKYAGSWVEISVFFCIHVAIFCQRGSYPSPQKTSIISIITIRIAYIQGLSESSTCIRLNYDAHFFCSYHEKEPGRNPTTFSPQSRRWRGEETLNAAKPAPAKSHPNCAYSNRRPQPAAISHHSGWSINCRKRPRVGDIRRSPFYGRSSITRWCRSATRRRRSPFEQITAPSTTFCRSPDVCSVTRTAEVDCRRGSHAFVWQASRRAGWRCTARKDAGAVRGVDG